MQFINLRTLCFATFPLLLMACSSSPTGGSAAAIPASVDAAGKLEVSGSGASDAAQGRSPASALSATQKTTSSILPSCPSTQVSALNTPAASTSAGAPHIFNATIGAIPGDAISIQGDNLVATSAVWLATSGNPMPLQTLDSVSGSQLTAQLPATLTGGIVIWVTNGGGTSNAVSLNGALPTSLDALQIVPGGAFRVLGRNLLARGAIPCVTVNGLPASITLVGSSPLVLNVTAPTSLSPTSAVVITVDNGNGTGPTQVDRPIAIVSGTGDPLSLGVGWAAGFNFVSRVINVSTACNGVQDDSANIQSAISTAANGGGMVRLPAGNCILMGSLTLPSNVVLAGAGKNVTFLEYQADYPIAATNDDLVGLQDFTLVNSGEATQGLIWKQNTRSFLVRLAIEMGTTYQLFLTSNTNIVVSNTDFVQGGSLGEQNPYLFTYSAGMVFSNNTSTSIDGSPTFEGVHDALFINNHFTRDASHQNESPVIATHQFVMDFAYRVSIIGNTFDVINGPVTNINRNDGETLLTEGGGGARTENVGTVASATSTSLYDPTTTLNTDPLGTGVMPEDYGVAIVCGTGAGQTREIIGYSGSTIQIDQPWYVIPDSSSHYATFVWGLEKSTIQGNTLIGNPRGIWLYQTAVRDVDVAQNTIVNGGGILLKPLEDGNARQFDPMFNVRVAGNQISNSDGVWMSYVDAIFVNKDPTAFGLASVGLELRNNILTANVPNVTSTTEDEVSHEGFLTFTRSEASGPTNSPMLVGTIFQGGQCSNCDAPFTIGTGDFGTVLEGTVVSTNPSALSDQQTLGSSSAASIGTIVVPVAN